MTNNEDIKKEADYYLENDVNITQASKKFGISKRTFQLHMKKLKEKRMKERGSRHLQLETY